MGWERRPPTLDFAPLIRVLDDYNVVVVEGFGYGYADQAADDDRTVENIADELHETLGQLGIGEPYVLAGHSLAGYYMLSYANQYPEEVSAVIGIDPTLPSDDHGQGAAQAAESSPGFNWGRLLSITGLVRWTIAIAPGLAEPDGSAFTPDELERMRLMASWNWDTPAVVEETARMGQNGGAVRGLTYPDELPVLTFLARGNGMSPDRLGRYEERLRNVRDHKIVVLDGGHYLHWTHSAEMAEQITAFLSEH
ncbi:alpha/beta hydrolase [Arthrobacter sp. Marseille-P9274]|uniref:alpha/beta hydrolase n=1 Tax=Arthrobacter sp. Marseille-P9274 TaxID=2866572 RepID=UPI0021C5BF4A|nr:alpha/beta hydrolase [Arthrobacter sp. Marseille-P9274]